MYGSGSSKVYTPECPLESEYDSRVEVGQNERVKKLNDQAVTLTLIMKNAV